MYFTKYLDADGLRGMRIGVSRADDPDWPEEHRALMPAALKVLEEAGAELVEVEDELELVDVLGSAVVLGLVPVLGLLFTLTAALAGNASNAVNRHAMVRHTAIFFINPSP